MSWARLDDRYPQHRKLRAAGPLRPLCIALDVTGICHCAEYATDGFIADADLPGVLEVLPKRMRQRVLAKLVEVGRWHRDDEAGGHWIHDWTKYNPTEEALRAEAERLERERERAAERKRRQRQRQRTQHPADVTVDVTRDSRRPSRVMSRPSHADVTAPPQTPPLARPDPTPGPVAAQKLAATGPPPPPTPPAPSLGSAHPQAAEPSDGGGGDPKNPRPSLHVVAPDRPPPPKLSAQLRAGNGEVPDTAKAAADAVLGAGWRERVRPRSDTDPAEFEAERQRQIAAIRKRFGEQFAPSFEHEPSEKPTETEHEVNTNRAPTEHETSAG